MYLQELQVGGPYKFKGQPELKLTDYNRGDFNVDVTPLASTRIIVLQKNEKSVRVLVKFKDKNKPNLQGRLEFKKNTEDYSIEEVA